MKLFITGAHGQLGTELQIQSQQLGWPHLAMDKDRLDITNLQAVRERIAAYNPDVVLNGAAYTAVDQAENDADTAFAVNRDGATNLAIVCDEQGIPLVHYSTDYIFDGNKSEAYTEDDTPSPLGVYGASKLEGERAVRQHCPHHLILRTSWVFSAHGHNFVKTMLRLGAEREQLGVVADQLGKPTSANELARVTLKILPHLNQQWGTYHLAQPEVTSWHGFAEAIFDTARELGVALKVQQVNKIGTADYPTPVQRPANSALYCAKIEQTFGVAIRPWQASLVDVVERLCDQQVENGR